MSERRLYDVECIEALYARCDELEGELHAAKSYIKYLQEVILAANDLEEYDALSYIDREAKSIMEFRDGKS